MTRFKECSWLEITVLCGAIMLIASIYGASAYTVATRQPQTVEFKVFQANVDYWPNIDMNQTQILTYGQGKYYFIGTWTGQLLLDHTYRVTYVQNTYAKRPWQNLIITEWEDIS